MVPMVNFLLLCACAHLVYSQSCVSFTTFNAGLTPFVPEYENRRGSAIPEAIIDDGSDVVCLQEYWQERDVQDLLDEAESVYPYHYSAIHYEIGQLREPRPWWQMFSLPDSACTAEEIFFFFTRVVPCALLSGCLDEFSESVMDGVKCLIDKCVDLIKSPNLSESCINCVVVGAGGVSGIFSVCANPNPFRPNNRLNTAGLVILSKLPMVTARYQTYFPGVKMGTQRGYLEAEITGMGTVRCTHLSAILEPYIEFGLDFESFEEQQNAEIMQARADFGDTDHIFLGDMNTGPEVSNADPEKDVDGEAPDNYALLLSYGYSSPYMDTDGRCTYCESNPLVTGFNIAIDHILIMGFQSRSVSGVQRVLDQNSPMTLSDHYGVKASVCQSSRK